MVALKKSVSAALKAAWHVEQLRARIEKPKRERNTLAKKLELQRAALEQVKATVDAILVEITPKAVVANKATPVAPVGQTLVETLAGPQSALDQAFGPGSTVVLDPSAAA